MKNILVLSSLLVAASAVGNESFCPGYVAEGTNTKTSSSHVDGMDPSFSFDDELVIWTQKLSNQFSVQWAHQSGPCAGQEPMPKSLQKSQIQYVCTLGYRVYVVAKGIWCTQWMIRNERYFCTELSNKRVVLNMTIEQLPRYFENPEAIVSCLLTDF